MRARTTGPGIPRRSRAVGPRPRGQQRGGRPPRAAPGAPRGLAARYPLQQQAHDSYIVLTTATMPAQISSVHVPTVESYNMTEDTMQRKLALAIIMEASPQEAPLVDSYWNTLADTSRTSTVTDTPLAFGSTTLVGLALPIVYWFIQELLRFGGNRALTWIKERTASTHIEQPADGAFDALMDRLRRECLNNGLEDDDFIRIRSAVLSVMVRDPGLFKNLLE